jgi:DNA polymerase III subunit gamma/tau
MNTIALARKYRPQTFAELVSQDHVTQALHNSLARNRLHHAYLFTGTRGVGKTSIARLFAKALCCEQGITPTPCLTCAACTAILQARYIDLIEIDAASKTRVEDTRELLDNVNYSPTQGRFKIYLIDEVHMLSTHSFNALLKTLEEPPAHVIFLLATTEVQKLPMTVLSRCLQFNLRPLPPEAIQKQLALILKQEKITCELDALLPIAKAADGSMRDALSILDQVIALSQSDDAIHLDEIKKTLGHTQDDYAHRVLDALADNQPETLMQISKAIREEGAQYAYVLDEILSYLHQISCLHIMPSETQLTALSQRFTPEDTQLFYQIALKGRDELSLAPTQSVGFEMTLLRMHAFKPAKIIANATPEPIQKAPAPTQKAPAQPSPSTVATPVKKTTPPPIETTQATKKTNTWEALIPKLNLTGLALNAAKQADLIFNADHTAAQLQFNKNHRSLFTPTVVDKIEQQLSAYYKKTLKLSLQSQEKAPDSPAEKERMQKKATQDEHQRQLDADPAFQTLKATFKSA